jgi:hypothetical protein
MEAKRSFNASGLQYGLVLLPFGLWIWLCRDWPTRLGFFCDDWMFLLHPSVGTIEAFRDIAKAVATRPASIPFIWLSQVAADWSPVRSQIFNAAMLLVTAASVGMLSAALLATVDRLKKGAVIGACFAAATFIVFPSTIGTFAWGIGVTAVVPATPFFCIGASLLLHADKNLGRLGVGLLLVLLSHLSYEAFYFQEITLILIAATLRGDRLADIPWRTVAAVVLVNAVCIAFNRLTTGGIQKTFHADFFQIFLGGYSYILPIFSHAVREHVVLVFASILGASLSGAICLAIVVGVARVPISLFLTACGVAAAGILYALAGYGLAAEGVPARVCIVLATYYSIAAGVLAAAAFTTIGRYPLLAVAFAISAAVNLLGLELTARARVAEWADTWSYELARLSRLPAALPTNLGKNEAQRIYVAIEKKQPSSVEPATAPWEINGAIAWAVYKATKSRLLTFDIWTAQRTAPYWFATPSNWFNRWDGKKFEQGVCGSNVATYYAPGSELWSWDALTGDVKKIDAPWQLGCG